MSNEDYLIPYYNSYLNNKLIDINNENIKFKHFLYYVNNNYYFVYTFYNNKIYYVDFNNQYNIEKILFGTLFYEFDNNYNIIRTWKYNNICYGILQYNNNYIIFKIENNILNSFEFNLPNNINIDDIYLQEFKINNIIYFSFIYLNIIYYFDFINEELKTKNIIDIIGDNLIDLPENTNQIDVYNFENKNYDTITDIQDNKLDKNDLKTFSGYYKNINNYDYFYFISFFKINNNSYFYQYINGEEYISLFNQNIIYNYNKLFYIAYIHIFNNYPIFYILTNNNNSNNILSNMYNSIFNYWYIISKNQYIIIDINNYYNIYELKFTNNYIPNNIILSDTSYNFQINKFDYFNIDKFINNNLFYHNKDNDNIIDLFNINNIKHSIIENVNYIYQFEDDNIIYKFIILHNYKIIIQKYNINDNILDYIKKYNILDFIYVNNKYYCISNNKIYIIMYNNNDIIILNYDLNDKIINLSSYNNNVYICLNDKNIYEIIINNNNIILNTIETFNIDILNTYYIKNSKYYYCMIDINDNNYKLYNNNNNIICKFNNKQYSNINLIRNILFICDNKSIYYIDNEYNKYNKILLNIEYDNILNYYIFEINNILYIIFIYLYNTNNYCNTIKINKFKNMYYNTNRNIRIKKNTKNTNNNPNYLYYIMNTIKNDNNNIKYNTHLNDDNKYIMKYNTLEIQQ